MEAMLEKTSMYSLCCKRKLREVDGRKGFRPKKPHLEELGPKLLSFKQRELFNGQRIV